MAQQTIGVGTTAGDGTGDTPRDGGAKINANFTELYSHASATANPHAVTQAQVGLANVDNTADADKPVSAAQAVVNAALAGDIASINTILASDETTLDDLQEVVDFIQLNRSDLDALSIGGVAGLQAALDAKQVALVSGTTIKTVNGSSLLGSGNLAVAGGGETSPRLIMGDKFYAVKGEEMQLYYRGMIEAMPPVNRYARKWSGIADAYRDYNRYFSVLQSVPFSHSTVELKLFDHTGSELADASTHIEIVDAVAQPTSATRVLCIGDSLTTNNSAAWVTEFNRLLTSNDAAATIMPAGKGFGNITMIGTQGSGANKHEGHSGRTWEWHSDPATSPFANVGQTALDFAGYVSANSFGGLEQVYVLLGWNSISSGGPLASDWSADVARAEALIDAILADYPACKITLMSMQVPGIEGRIGNRNYVDEMRAVFGYKLAIKGIADDPTYSANVDWIDIAAQFDSQYHYNNTSTRNSTRGVDFEDRSTDGVHPALYGSRQIADAGYRHFVGTWCQG